MAVLKTVLNIAFDTTASAAAMLRMKDFVLLVCSALGESSAVMPTADIIHHHLHASSSSNCSACPANAAIGKGVKGSFNEGVGQ